MNVFLKFTSMAALLVSMGANISIASNDLDGFEVLSSNGNYQSQQNFLNNLREEYAPPASLSWKQISELANKGLINIDGKEYAADQYLANSFNISGARKGFCKLGSLIRLTTTTDIEPARSPNHDLTYPYVTYAYSYKVQNTAIYRDNEYFLHLRPILSEDDMIHMTALQLDTATDVKIAMTVEELHTMVTNARLALTNIANNVARELAIKASIQAAEALLESASTKRKALVLVGNSVANIFGYSNMGEVVVEHKTHTTRQTKDSTLLRNVSSALWYVPTTLFPSLAAAQYVAGATAKLKYGSDTLTQAVLGEYNGLSEMSNKQRAAADLVKAGVCLVPFGNAVIAISGVAAKRFLGTESLTEAGLKAIFGDGEA